MKSASSACLPTKAMEAQDIPAGEQWSTWYHLCPSMLYPVLATVWPKPLPYLYEIFFYKKSVSVCINAYFGIYYAFTKINTSFK